MATGEKQKPTGWAEKAARTLVLLYLLWPLVHMCVVQQAEVSPWRFGGLAMYGVVWEPPSLEVELRVNGEWEPAVRLVEGNDHLFEAARHADARREEYYGKAFTFPNVSRFVRQHVPEADVMRIEVGRRTVEPDSAKVVWRTYERVVPLRVGSEQEASE
jgi:hypothetical protein